MRMTGRGAATEKPAADAGTADAEASTDVKARHPLRAAQIKVYPVPGRPGAFNCTMHLAPHYELDELNATVTLQAELTPARVAT